jgi:thioredoxin reductase
VHLQNFVTRDGTPPDQFRALARQELARYPTVEVRDVRAESVSGARGAFRVALGSGAVTARRLLLAVGMIDEPLPLEGFRELWGHSIFQCPYCHGWEARDRRWGYLARAADVGHLLFFVMQLRGWTKDLTLFTGGAFELPEDARATLERAGINLETRPLARLVGREQHLESVELVSGERVPCEVLFAHPPQRQVELVRSLGVALDADGYVQLDAMKRETSVPGIYAAGDLTTRLQGAVIAAAAGTVAAAMLNVDLSMEAR